MNTIDSFQGSYRWLSNFWPCTIEIKGHVFPNTENAYQAMKTSEKNWPMFYSCTPGKAKRLGQSFKLREDWEQVKDLVMQECLAKKFAKGSSLGNALEATGDVLLVEGNTWNDTYWGVCNGIGQNKLGMFLMQQRAYLLATPAIS